MTTMTLAAAPVKATRTADSLILEAIEAYRSSGLPAAYDLWEGLTDSQRSKVNGRLIAYGMPRVSSRMTAESRFQQFVSDAADGNAIEGPYATECDRVAAGLRAIVADRLPATCFEPHPFPWLSAYTVTKMVQEQVKGASFYTASIAVQAHFPMLFCPVEEEPVTPPSGSPEPKTESTPAPVFETKNEATRFDAESYLQDAIEAVRCGQPGVATDVVDGPHFAAVKADDTCECWDDAHHVAAGTYCERCQDEMGREHYAATRRKATVDQVVDDAPEVEGCDDEPGPRRMDRAAYSDGFRDGFEGRPKAWEDEFEGTTEEFGDYCRGFWQGDRERDGDPCSARLRIGEVISDSRHGDPHATRHALDADIFDGATEIVAFLDHLGIGPDPHGRGEFGRLNHFVSDCINGVPVSFPRPPSPEDTDECQSCASTATSTALRGEATSSPTTVRCSTAPSDTTTSTTRATTRADGAGTTASNGNRTTTATPEDTPEPEPMGLMVEGETIAYLDAFDPDDSCTDVNHFRDTTNMIGQVDQPSTYLPEDRRNSFGGNETTASTKVDPDETITEYPMDDETCCWCELPITPGNPEVYCTLCRVGCCRSCVKDGLCELCSEDLNTPDPDDTVNAVNPGFHAIHPSPMDCDDVLALRAFGLV